VTGDELRARVVGALVGVAVGDAVGAPLARLAPAALPEDDDAPAAHAALTSWTLTVVDSLLYRRPDAPLLEDLATRLCMLAGPLRGLALRGRPQSFAGTLRQVADALDSGEDPRLCGVDDVIADGLCACAPLLLSLGDDDDDVARAIGDVVALSHRHLRVATSAGLWVFGVRSWARRTGAPLDEHLEAAATGARRVLEIAVEQRAGVAVGRRTEAEGAVALAVAEARQQTVSDMLLTPGLDARDTPERLAAAAVRAPADGAHAAAEVALHKREVGGDADVTIPLLLSTVGALHGADELPLLLARRLATRALIEERATALCGPRPPSLRPLVEDELRVSRGQPTAEDPQAEASTPREQLALL
jgi:ADP-ribosylglycohydrolase